MVLFPVHVRVHRGQFSVLIHHVQVHSRPDTSALRRTELVLTVIAQIVRRAHGNVMALPRVQARNHRLVRLRSRCSVLRNKLRILHRRRRLRGPYAYEHLEVRLQVVSRLRRVLPCDRHLRQSGVVAVALDFRRVRRQIRFRRHRVRCAQRAVALAVRRHHRHDILYPVRQSGQFRRPYVLAEGQPRAAGQVAARICGRFHVIQRVACDLIVAVIARRRPLYVQLAAGTRTH